MTEIHRRWRLRRIVATVVAAVAVAAACNSNTNAGEQLAGTWANASAQLSANSTSAEYVATCVQAEFLPITLDANRSFIVQSSSVTVSGNIQITRDTRLELNGHFIGDSLQLQVRLVNLASGVNDPIVVVLTPGSLSSVPVCSA